jgi:hypothetical protein
MILRADDDGMRGILSDSARSGFPVFETIVTFPFKDSQDKAGSPLAQEEKFAAFAVICGENPRQGTRRFLAGAHFHPEGEGERKIDGSSRPEKRLLSRHDSKAFEPKAGRSTDPPDVVRGPESKRPQARKEESQRDGENDEGEKLSVPVFSGWGLHSLPYTDCILIPVRLEERWSPIIPAIVSFTDER